jgi:type IV secretion system protein VirD4
MFKILPRGLAAGKPESAPRGQWLAPENLDESWQYDERRTPGSVLLGQHDGKLLGRGDDRHVTTVGGNRAGKSLTVLIPNLSRYKGSVVVIDPKGELAAHTAALRASWGHKVFILNPFKVHGWISHGHNPCAELLRSPKETLAADAAQLADALIIEAGKEPHWTDSAKNLITGLLLHTLTTKPDQLSIATLRRQLSQAAELPNLFQLMALNDELDGVISNVGNAMLAKYDTADGKFTPSGEMRSILSTALEQTRPLDDLGAVFGSHDFQMDDFANSETPITVYLVLPATRIATHARWLRLFIYQLLAALERKPIPRDRLPLWLILEEFAALGYMRALEAAAGYFAGFGIKLWTILQDLTQIKTHYPKSWETFLGNSGVIQAFANVDVTTTRYLSELLGETTIIEEQKTFVTAQQRGQGDDGVRRNLRSVPLLSPSELSAHFARESRTQLILVPGEKPVFMQRLGVEMAYAQSKPEKRAAKKA